MRTNFAFIVAVSLAVPALGQDSRSLEGMTVALKMDMPGSSDGVEVRPLAGGIDSRAVAASIHANGVGVHTGESIMITKVVVKGHHIEVQLGGGGFGTFRDVLAMSAATPTVPYETKSKREKDLEDEAKYSPDYWERQRARDELHRTQNDRYRDNTVAAVVNAQTQAQAKNNERVARAQSGSRFNIRYDAGFPPGATSAQGIMDVLSRYVDFSGGAPPPTPSSTPATPSINGLRKGLTVAQAEQILGPAARVSQRPEGSIETTIREYSSGSQSITAQFVGGVLVDYKITPR